MKGICFKELLFHATIEGRKTQTRRIITPPPVEIMNGIPMDSVEVQNEWENAEEQTMWMPKVIKPRYKVGEVVYLKEPYQLAVVSGERKGYVYFYGCDRIADYEADYSWFREVNPSEKWLKKWAKDQDKRQNKLFMPAEAARYFIRITAVRAERLQEISTDDCAKEGIEEILKGRLTDDGCHVRYGLRDWPFYKCHKTRQDAYAALIDKINGKGTWDSNPWVWVYDYELTNKPE